MTTTETYRRSSNLIIGKTATSPPSDLRRGLHTLASIRQEADSYTSSRKSTFGMGADFADNRPIVGTELGRYLG